MTFVLKRKHWCVLDCPLASKISISREKKTKMLVHFSFEFMCGALCTDTHRAHAAKSTRHYKDVRHVKGSSAL